MTSGVTCNRARGTGAIEPGRISARLDSPNESFPDAADNTVPDPFKQKCRAS